MKTFSARQLTARYAVAFTLGALIAWGSGKTSELIDETTTKMRLGDLGRQIARCLCAQLARPTPSFEDAIRQVNDELRDHGRPMPIDASLWHPLNALVIPRGQPMGKPHYVAYCETLVGGKYLVISADGTVDWLPARELHSLLENRSASSAPVPKS